MRQGAATPIAEAPVVIAGAGPTGLMLAGELALGGVSVVLVERRAAHDLTGSRAGGLHARTLEILDQRGIVDRFLVQGKPFQIGQIVGVPLDISDFPTRHGYGLALWQKYIERTLAEWVAERGVPVLYGREVVGCAQDADGVDVRLADGATLRARYLVGCDGGRSLIRKAAGIEFPGWDASTSNLIAEVELADEPPWGMRRDALGLHGLVRSEEGPVRVMLTERQVRSGEPTLDELREALIAVYGTDYGVHSPTSLSRFTDMTRQAANYRDRRVFLAGDAAHVHAPDGGQGLQLGVHDAVNLGWKLAQVVRGSSPDALLDTYQAERHPVTARVLRTTMAHVALRTPGDRMDALREVLTELLATDEARRRFAGKMSGLDIRYDLGDGHPLLGRRMPDLDLVTAEGSVRVYTLLHQARGVLISFGSALDAAPWADRVVNVAARYDGVWSLPVLGPVAAPAAVLVRPDGYVAWVGAGTDTGLHEALVRWFGPR